MNTSHPAQQRQKKSQDLQEEVIHLKERIAFLEHQLSLNSFGDGEKQEQGVKEVPAASQSKRLDNLINLSAALGSTCSKEEICALTCEYIKKLIQADRYSLLFFCPCNLYYSVFSYQGISVSTDHLKKQPIVGSSLEAVQKHQERLNIGNLQTSDYVSDKNTLSQEIRSLIHCPIMIFDELVGTLTVSSCKEDNFDQLDEKFLSLISIIVSRSLESQSFSSQTKLALDVAEKSEYELQLMNRIVETSPVVLMNWGAYGDIPLEYVSKNVTRVFGYVHDEIRDFDFIHPDDSAKVHEELELNDQQGFDEFTQTYRLVTKSGEIRWVDDLVLIKRDRNGESTHYQSVLFDITDRKNYEAELLQTQMAAKTANMAKDQLLTNMSHELRTPLNAVLGLTQLLKVSSLDQEQREFVNMIDDGGEDLLSIINNLLDISALEKEEYTIQKAPIYLKEFLESRHAYAKFLATNKPVDVTQDLDPDLPETIYQDLEALNKVIDHLIENAVKFTETGIVSLHATAIPDEYGLSVFKIEVCDTGQGISEADQQDLFQAFSQIDGSLTRQFGGNGLGLAICAKLIQAIGGTISVESSLGSGSSFSIEIPY